MQRIDNSGAVASLPEPLAAGIPGYFGRGNPGSGLLATPLSADWANMVQEELYAIVIAAGLVPSKTVRTQVRDAIELLYKGLFSGGQVSLTGSTALTAVGHAGKLILINAAGATTQTLPAASSVPAGKQISFLNIAAGTTAITRAGADTITVSNITVASLSALTGDTLLLESNGLNGWYAVDGTARNGYAASVQLQKFYESTQQVITSAGGLTLPHGLGVEPKNFFFYLVNVTAQAGFTPGEKAMVTPSNSNRETSIFWDATNIGIRFDSNTSVFYLAEKNTGASVALTNANWRLVVRAWA